LSAYAVNAITSIYSTASTSTVARATFISLKLMRMQKPAMNLCHINMKYNNRKQKEYEKV
jgi:hypothetical protein